MSGWAGSNRAARLPKDWPAIRRAVLRRDHGRCTWLDHGQPCGRPATDIDHIIPGDDHRLANLRSLCRTHHQAKSSAEGHAARYRNPRRRPAEPHPGLLSGA